MPDFKTWKMAFTTQGMEKGRVACPASTSTRRRYPASYLGKLKEVLNRTESVCVSCSPLRTASLVSHNPLADAI